ncbi:DUF3152 domain-containing protein [Streptomyces hebeiensis]
MGRHSRKSSAPEGAAGPPADGRPPDPAAPGSGRRRRFRAGPAAAPRAAGPGDTAVRDIPAGGPPVRDTPAHGTPAHGVPQVRGGHPEQRERGGGWGSAQTREQSGEPRIREQVRERHDGPQGAARRPSGPGGTAAPARETRPPGPRPSGPGSSEASPPDTGAPLIPGPRREFVDAFDSDAFGAPSPRALSRETAPADFSPPGGAAGRENAEQNAEQSDHAASGKGGKGGKGLTYTGVVAAAVTTVLAVVVAGQVADGGGDPRGARAAGDSGRGGASEDASRSDGRGAPDGQTGRQTAVQAPPGYAELMARQFPAAAVANGTGEFAAVPGFAEAPGKGRKVRYRVDVEKGLDLDAELFADAVQKTLNDDRSWAHNGAMTFERISSGEPDFVITLAGPKTTGVWCAKSGLDTTVDNVSCDSAATERVMINAFRWARGAETFGAKAMFPYRQMLINHEVGHRLGHNHVNCRTPGELAPVMQQQTKSLDIDGIECKPNPWVYPEG